MTIVPSGKIRVLMAQRIEEPRMQGLESSPVEESANSIPPDITTGLQPEISQPEIPQQEISKQEDTLTAYIFKKLESFGYPGRRLEEKKSEFVKENIAPDGTKNKTVKIPDKYYPGQDGVTKMIEDDEISNIAKEIQQKFGLHFNGADRSSGEWSISFTSADVQKKEAPISDNLDEVYGNPTKSNKGRKKEPVRALTLEELMKQSKNNVLDKLNKIINGEKNAS